MLRQLLRPLSRVLLVYLGFGAIATAVLARTETLVADPKHSSIEFRTRHWDIVDIIGWFEAYDIRVEVDDGRFEGATVIARVEPGSVHMPRTSQ